MRDQLILAPDTVDVADVVRTLKRQWRAVMSFLALGVIGALAVIFFAPKRYEGKASVLARTSGSGSASILSRMSGGVGELLGGVGGLSGSAAIETELQMLRSRVLAGQVVDSLKLQVRVRKPARVTASQVVQSHQITGAFEPRAYVIERADGGRYRITGDSVERMAVPGQPVTLDVGAVTLAAGIPPKVTVKIYDREEAITRMSKRLVATKAGGEVAKINYKGDDPITAAAVPNALIDFYLARRKTVDRGSNQRRVEYVTEQVEQTAAQLATAEKELRREQEASGVFDAEITDVAQQEATGKLRESLIQLQIDEASLRQLLAQADKGQVTSRDIAAHPAFMKGSAVSPMVSQLSDLEIQKTRLLERRTERDPEVIAIDNSMKAVNASIIGMARSYHASVARQREDFESRLAVAQRALTSLPAANERVGRLRRDVLRLTQLYAALQAQLVEARLGAIGEGGEVRQVDVAAAPRKPSFPQPFLTMGIGTAGGLLMGMIAALFLGWFGRWLRDPAEIERVTGIAAQRFQSDAPLLVSGATSPRTVLVVPLGDGAQSGVVAERLARTASARSLPVSVLDFSGNGNGKEHPALSFTDIARQIDQLEQQHEMLVVQLPTLSSETTLAALSEKRPVVLVAPPGPVDRTRLTSALETLRRMQIPCAGIVISDPPGRPRALI